jgi:hypothetical protein
MSPVRDPGSTGKRTRPPYRVPSIYETGSNLCSHAATLESALKTVEVGVSRSRVTHLLSAVAALPNTPAAALYGCG